MNAHRDNGERAALMDKAAWRQEARRRRRLANIPQESAQIVAHVSTWPVFQAAPVILAYMGLPDEIQLQGLMNTFPDKTWFLPRIQDCHHMAFYRYQNGDPLYENAFGILEPAPERPFTPQEIGPEGILILVPALAVDRHGHRLGYGRGYYDRVLVDGADCNKVSACPVVSTCRVDTLPQDPWDQPVDVILTRDGITVRQQ